MKKVLCFYGILFMCFVAFVFSVKADTLTLEDACATATALTQERQTPTPTPTRYQCSYPSVTRVAENLHDDVRVAHIRADEDSVDVTFQNVMERCIFPFEMYHWQLSIAVWDSWDYYLCNGCLPILQTDVRAATIVSPGGRFRQVIPCNFERLLAAHHDLIIIVVDVEQQYHGDPAAIYRAERYQEECK